MCGGGLDCLSFDDLLSPHPSGVLCVVGRESSGCRTPSPVFSPFLSVPIPFHQVSALVLFHLCPDSNPPALSSRYMY